MILIIDWMKDFIKLNVMLARAPGFYTNKREQKRTNEQKFIRTKILYEQTRYIIFIFPKKVHGANLMFLIVN